MHILRNPKIGEYLGPYISSGTCFALNVDSDSKTRTLEHVQQKQTRTNGETSSNQACGECLNR